MAYVAVLGAGPHGHEVAMVAGETVGAVNLYDDRLPDYPPIAAAHSASYYAVGAVWPEVRRTIAAKADAMGIPALGPLVFPGARVGQGVVMRGHVHVLYNAVVSHGCWLDSYVTVASGAVLCGEVTVGEGAFIGANATVLHGGITIGEGAMIGAGAVVTKDVAPYAVVAGVPAHALGSGK